MRFFYDLEFLEDGKTIDLISIGVVAEDGREYYAINSDAPWNLIKANDWLVRNVLPSLPVEGRTALDTYLAHPQCVYPRPTLGTVGIDMTDARVKPRWVIANEVRDFLVLHNPERDSRQTELWAFCGAYDHVGLAQLWGSMPNLPEGIPMWTNDVLQEEQRLGNPAMPEQVDGLDNALEDARHVCAMWERLNRVAHPAQWANGAEQ